MARMTKFSSVNLNESYGKPEQAGSTSASANSSTSSKPRPVTQGGMLVLTRPSRGQSTGVKPGRLGIPSPVNLPSLKRESSAGDAHVPLSTSPSLPGWTKGGQGESLTPNSGNVNGEITEKPGAGRSSVLSGGARVGLLDNVTEERKGVLPPAVGKSDVYTPPRLRAMQASGGLPPHIPPPSPADKAAIIRGEEFPTLQASLARPPTPPQQQRQKEIQQKHREKQLEVKEQQFRLQQLSLQQQSNADKQIFGDTCQAPTDGLLLQPAQPRRPNIKQEQPQKEVAPASINQSFGQCIRDGDGTLSRPPPLVRLNHVSNWADDERERGMDNRPQDGSPSVQVGQNSPSIHTQQSGYSNEVDVSWTSMHRSNMPSRNGDTPRNSRDFRTSSDDDLGGREGSDLRGSSFEREDSLSRFDSGIKNGISTGFGGVEGYAQQDFGKEGSAPSSFGRVVGPVHETVQGREGSYVRGWVGREPFYRDAREPYNTREPYNRDARESYNRDSREPYNRDAREPYNRDSREPYNRDAREPYIRDSRDPYSRDSREPYKRDFKETYNKDPRESHYRDARDTYTRDIKEVYNQDVNMSGQMGYGNFNNDGGNMHRGDIVNNGSPRGRVNYFAGVGAAFHNPGFGHDARHSRRYGFHSTGGDHPFLKEARPGSDSRIARGRYMEPPVAHEGLGGRRNRVSVLGSSFHDNARESYDAGLERTQNLPEERQKLEAKGTEVKVTTEEGSDYTSWKSLSKDDKPEEPVDISKKLQDERRSGEDEKMPGSSEERRKEAARRKLLELEERIAQRKAEERRKEEVETKAKVPDKKLDDVTQMNAPPSFKEAREEATVNLEFKEEDKGIVFERNMGVGWKEEDLHSKLTRPSSASSSSSWTFRGAGEELSREQDFGPGAVETKFTQEQKVLRSKSPISWRKEANFNSNGPISKLFSSPYIESGSLHRPTDGGNYKLF